MTGLVYEAIRDCTRLVGIGLDGVLGALAPVLGEQSSSLERDLFLSALNGVVGDRLTATENPLAIEMQWRKDGAPLQLTQAALCEAYPQPSPHLLLLVHGACMSERLWRYQGHDHGALLGQALGMTPLSIQYNSGLHISTNGEALSQHIDALVSEWPVEVESLTILGFSMGGLVTRSACHQAKCTDSPWLRRLEQLVFLGSPHHGAPLERVGNGVDTLFALSPYTAPLACLGQIRSAGITDLRYGNLMAQDWAGADRFVRGDRRTPVPLPEGVRCFAIAGMLASHNNPQTRWLGDGLVPVESAFGQHTDPRFTLDFPNEHLWLGHNMSHMDLLCHNEVYEQLKRWLLS